MRKVVLYLIFCAISFCGCRKDVNIGYKEIVGFSLSHNVIGENIPLNTDVFFPRNLLLINDTTIAVTEINDDYGVKILRINRNSLNLKMQLGRKGEGPDDVIFGVTKIQKDIYNSSEGIWIGDSQSMKFHPYHTGLDVWEEGSSCKKKLPHKSIPCSESFVLKDFALLGISTSINSHIFIYSQEKDTLNEYDFYPVSPNPYNYLMSKTVYSGDIRLKPDKSHFVLTYELFKSLCIVDLNKLSEPLFLKFEDTPFPQIGINNGELNIDDIRNLPMQYIDIYTTDNFIYALYAGKTSEELGNFSPGSSQGMSVHIFKWDGTAHCLLNLDRLVNCICVDEVNSVIYGIDPTGEDNSIFYKFSVPENIINL
jgi:hypothetical protein